jgi:hypothetical protein
MIHTLANSVRYVLHAMKYFAGAMAVLAAAAGVAHADSSGSGNSVPEIDPSSVLSALTLMVGGVLMMYDTVRRR